MLRLARALQHRWSVVQTHEGGGNMKPTKMHFVEGGLALLLALGGFGAIAACDAEQAPQPEVKRTVAKKKIARVAPKAVFDAGVSKEQEVSRGPTEKKIEVSYEDALKLAMEAKQAGRVEDALAAFTDATTADATKALPFVQRARILITLKRLPEARVAIEKGIELEETSLAYNTLGRIELLDSENGKAEVAFKTATTLDEKNIYAWNNLGLARIRQQKWIDAASALSRATSSEKAKSYMFNNLGIVYERLGEREQALGAYKTALLKGSGAASANYVRLEQKLAKADTPPTAETPSSKQGG